MCTLIDEMKTRITECMKTANSFERDILKTVLGEIQTIKSRTGKMNNDGVIKVFKKFAQGVVETIQILDGRDAEGDRSELKAELAVYERFIPTTLSVDAIVELLSGDPAKIIATQLKDANSDGQATGIAMGILKKSGMAVDGKDVSEAVKKIRA